MPSWYTTFDRACADPRLAKLALISLQKVAKLAEIPSKAHWKASPRGFGIVIFAEWAREDIK